MNSIPVAILHSEVTDTALHLCKVLRRARSRVADHQGFFDIHADDVTRYNARLHALQDVYMMAGMETEKMHASAIRCALWKVWRSIQCERVKYLARGKV